MSRYKYSGMVRNGHKYPTQVWQVSLSPPREKESQVTSVALVDFLFSLSLLHILNCTEQCSHPFPSYRLSSSLFSTPSHLQVHLPWFTGSRGYLRLGSVLSPSEALLRRLLMDHGACSAQIHLLSHN
jgi:hypothetical protein